MSSFTVKRIVRQQGRKVLVAWQPSEVTPPVFKRFRADVVSSRPASRGRVLVHWRDSWVAKTDLKNTEDEKSLKSSVLRPKYKERDVDFKIKCNEIYAHYIRTYFYVDRVREFHLDAENARTYHKLVEIGVNPKRIFVANNDRAIQSRLRTQVSHLFEGDAVKFFKTKRHKFDAAYLDFCCGPDVAADTLAVFLDHCMGEECLLGVTFFTGRQKTNQSMLPTHMHSTMFVPLAGLGRILSEIHKRRSTHDLLACQQSGNLVFVLMWVKQQNK